MVWKFSRTSTEIGILSSVLLIYAALGSPTPAGLSVAEILQAFGLMWLVFFSWSNGYRGSIDRVFAAFFLFSLYVGLLSAFGNESRQIIRDVIAHLFLGIGVLWFRHLTARQLRAFAVFAAGMGAVIALRFLIETGFRPSLLDETTRFTFDGRLKLNTDPLVVFCAAYGLVAPLNDKISLREKLFLFFCGCVGALAIGLSGLRMPMAIVVATVAFAVFRGGLFTRWRGLFSLVLFSFLVVGLYPYISIFIENFLDKMERGGTSEKLREFLHVMGTSGDSVRTFLFGSGMGAMIDLGPRSLAFTHSIFSYYYAKSGVLSLFLLLLYFLLLCRKMLRALPTLHPMTFAIFLIVLQGFLINPHYKYMTFGILLLILHVALNREVHLATRDAGDRRYFGVR